MKILLIGGNGYIGSSLYTKLKDLSFDVTSIDLCLFGVDLGYSIKMDYSEFDISGYSHIVLLAAHSSVSMCEISPSNAWVNNVDKLYNVCSKLRNEQFLIYASSGSVYGKSLGMSTEHSLNLYPLNYYDLTKITGDIIANKFIEDGKKIVGLRFGTLNGFSYNLRSDLMINSMIINGLNNGVISVSNPNIHRPILSINDCVNSIFNILTSSIFVSGHFNLSSFNATVDDISKTVGDIMNVPLEYLENTYDKSYDFTLDTKKFEDCYNYKFKDSITDIIETLTTVPLLNYASRHSDIGYI